MAFEEQQIVQIRNDFYRDRFGKVLLVAISLLIAIILLICLSVYIYLSKPKPIFFRTGAEWRVQPDVPINQAYLPTADVLQWVSEVIPKSFTYDFNYYSDQLKAVSEYFTPDGWKVFLNQLNSYVNYNNVQTYKMFVSAVSTGAPYILNQGLLSGRYAWWVQLPINITYQGYSNIPARRLTLQILVVRVSTLNNLSGIGIDNVIVENPTGSSKEGT
ncbi:MAG: hypothetical protein A3F12_06885 [Gammaproteobacteria bacterium RIFCSPHIGHO2_12_FULL_38_14]|nr:MAG: hypothetical protein A3F12_06885 [Gammaproteobacteria bacterium RIFCSPHIGHO2_12_FULL_38_14]